MKTTPIRTTALAVAIAAAYPALAQTAATPTTLAPVIVTANGIPTRDSDAAYASEVHDRAAIEASGATTLADYLAQYTSLNVLPGFGNKNAPMIDMRGYGIENGYQNIAVLLDGQRLNNIDMTQPLLGSIPLSSIESIEISKGSGSVAFGDNAMAGAIQIRTRAYTGVSVSAITGSRGMQSLGLNAGLSRELFDLSFSANNDKQGYSSDRDVAGQRDGSDNRTEQAKLTLKPITGLKLLLDGMSARIDTRYPGPLSPAAFNANPAQNGGNTYTYQNYETKQMGVGAEYEFFPGLTASYRHGEENKRSFFRSVSFLGPFESDSNYGYSSDDLKLAYRSSTFDVAAGAQRFKGVREGDTGVGFNHTTKDNTAYYLQGIYRLGKLALSAGVREENVEYSYVPQGGVAQNREHDLRSWDVGANYRFSNSLSIFANHNSAFQAPDIDRFFTFGAFNGFIQPAKAHTTTVGINHDTARNKLRVSAFYSRLRNEIYYDVTIPPFGSNSNIDKSHKQGIEVQDRWQVRDDLMLSLLYTYTRAVIDEEGSGATALNDKRLPGVPRHGLTLGAIWKPWANTTLAANHVWRDSAYAMNDLGNDFQYRQSIYSSTSVSLRQRFGKIEGFVGVDNLFDRANGISINDFAIYPVDFRRTWKIGAKIDLF